LLDFFSCFWAFRNKGSSKTRLKKSRKFFRSRQKKYLLTCVTLFFHGAPWGNQFFATKTKSLASQLRQQWTIYVCIDMTAPASTWFPPSPIRTTFAIHPSRLLHVAVAASAVAITITPPPTIPADWAGVARVRQGLSPVDLTHWSERVGLTNDES
jgi:hypothetical protein